MPNDNTNSLKNHAFISELMFQMKNDKNFCYFLRYVTVIFNILDRMKKNRPCLGGVLCGNQFLKS